MSADKKTIKKKIETAILVLSAIVIVFLIVWTIYTMLNYISVKTVYDLNEQEYAAICEEYLLDPQTADIEYIFCQGRDVFGCRLLLSENDLEDMNILFAEQAFDNEYSDYFNVKEKHEVCYRTSSDGIKREIYSLEFSETSPKKIRYNVFCYVFENDGKYYMEMYHQHTKNAAIYCKNIRS